MVQFRFGSATDTGDDGFGLRQMLHSTGKEEERLYRANYDGALGSRHLKYCTMDLCARLLLTDETDTDDGSSGLDWAPKNGIN
jgi:hypothetical protein